MEGTMTMMTMMMVVMILMRMSHGMVRHSH
jgi:hypothetical protein